MQEILIACNLPAPVTSRFADAFALRDFDMTRPLTEQCAGCSALVLSVERRVDADLLAALPESVRTIATYSVGTDHINLAEIDRRGLNVLNTPDVLSVSVAETALLLALGASRRATESIDLIRSRAWSGWTPTQLIGRELAGKTAGIFGMGRIGREIASRMRAIGMAVAYHNRSRLAPELEAGAAHHPTLDGLLAVSDLLILASPATPDTIGLFDADRIARMKAGAILVNIARGSLVNDGDLIAALTTGHLGAAGLDVFNNEPKLDPRYFDLPNVFILPHIGSSTMEARIAMGDILIAGLQALARGERPANLVSA